MNRPEQNRCKVELNVGKNEYSDSLLWGEMMK